MFKYLLLSSIFFLFSCSSIKMLSDKDYYSDEFLKKIDTVQSIYKDGLKSEALQRLKAINDKDLNDVEKAKKYNFIGIIKFSNDDTQGAITEFEMANSFKNENLELKNQILLNLSSCFYKIEQFEYAKNYLKQIDASQLNAEEANKYAKLKLVISQKFDLNEDVIAAIFYLGKKLETFNDVKQFDYLSLLKSSFSKLSESQKIFTLESNTDNVLAAFLAKDEAFKRMLIGNKDGVKDIIDWLDDKFSHIEDVRVVVDDYRSNLQNYTKIDSKAIGVILPLSDKTKSRFAKKALFGIEAALNNEKIKENNLVLHIKDNHDNPSVSAKAVRELILNHNVSVIVGGLYSSNAKAQYLEARKYGVLFISMSTVDLPKSEKSPLLIEIPGSLQSQIVALTDPLFLKTYGNRVALLYPDDSSGNIYANEFWNLHEEKIIEITTINSFSPEIKDFRSVVKKLLSLEYPRQRSEELKILKEIHNLEDSKSTVRRKQNLEPIIDFDWVFIPTYPNSAIQILPTFSFLEAKKLTFFGTPSWATSKQLMIEQNGWGSINLVGDDVENYKIDFRDEFKVRNKKSLGLIEIKGYEALLLSSNIISSLKFSDRGEFSKFLIEKKSLNGITGDWKLSNSLWIKNMAYLHLGRKKMTRINLESSN